MTLGIRAHLGLTVTGSVVLVFVALAVAAVERDRRALVAGAQARADATLAGIAVPASIAIASTDYATLDTLVAEVQRAGSKLDLIEFGVIDPDGRIVAHSDPERFGERIADPFVQRARTSDAPLSDTRGNVLRVAAPAHSGMRWGTLVATFSLSHVHAAILERRNLLAVACGVSALVLLVLVVVGLQVAVVRPVRKLRTMAEALRAGDLDHRATPLGGAELKELADTFNAMAGALKDHRDHLSDLVAERTRALSEANARLERLAVTDGLTGLHNHRYFHETLAAEIKRASRTHQPLSLLMIDVDHFKRFNDSRGHPAGDDLLRSLGGVIRNELRTTDTVARYGGEEFAVILPDTARENAIEAAEKLRAAVEKSFDRDTGRVTVSLGVAAYPVDAEGPQSLLRAADEALYQAKGSGRNRVVAAARVLDKVV